MNTVKERLAAAWLEGVVDPAVHLAGAAEMLPQQRTKILEGAYETIKTALVASIRSEVSALLKAEEDIALSNEVDPLFLNWFIVNGRHWPPMSPRSKDALRTMQSIYIWFGAVPDQWKNMQAPDVGEIDQRDAALEGLAQWFVKTALPRIERDYVNAIWKMSRLVGDALRGENSREPKTAIALMQDFELRLLADTFQLKPAVQRVVDLFE